VEELGDVLLQVVFHSIIAEEDGCFGFDDITDACRDMIVKAYGEFRDGAVYGNKSGVYCQSKIFDNEEFGYRKITVERPLRYNYATAEDRLAALKETDVFDDCRGLPDEYNPSYPAYQAALRTIAQDRVFDNEKDFRETVNKTLTQYGLEHSSATLEFIALLCSREDDVSQIVTKRGKPVPSTAKRDTENVPLTEDVETYFRREVLPYAPDAWIDEKKTKIGYEIPMTRYFYEYQAPEKTEDIMARITALEQEISQSLQALFRKEG